MKNLKVLVVGGAGYIGSHLVRTLKKEGCKNVVVLDNLSSGHKFLAERAGADYIATFDCSNPIKLFELFNEYKFDVVFHLGAFSIIPNSIKNPIDYYINNVYSTAILLDVMKIAKCNAIVFSSSAAVYGNPSSYPINEEHELAPINPYGKTKVAMEWLISDVSRSSDVKFIALRYFNAAGADYDGDIGERHNPETHLIPLLINSAIKDTEFNIYGNNYDTEDGTAIRDYVHVNDIAKAHILCSKYLLDGGKSDVYNIGTGNGTSVLEIINSLSKILNEKILYSFQERRVGDPPILVASYEKIMSNLNWRPEIGIDDILKTAWGWHSDF